MADLTAYITTTERRAQAILSSGWTDHDELAGHWGVYVTPSPAINDPSSAVFSGKVILSLTIPASLYRRYVLRTVRVRQEDGSGKVALIPAKELNRLDEPQVYDHPYAGLTRDQLLQKLRHLLGDDPEIFEVQDAIAFLDEIGWQTPLKLKNSGEPERD